MIIAVDAASAVPTFEQIRSQIATMIAAGVLPPGTPLPSIRLLARDLDLAPGTVARAYKELEREGLVSGRAGRGTRVEAARRDPEAPDLAGLDDAARSFVLRARQLGADPQTALAAVRALADSGLASWA